VKNWWERISLGENADATPLSDTLAFLPAARCPPRSKPFYDSRAD